MAISSGNAVGGKQKAKTAAGEGLLVDSIARKLREQGEQFMRMFDDYESGEKKEAKAYSRGGEEANGGGLSEGEEQEEEEEEGVGEDEEEEEEEVDGEGGRKLPHVIQFISPPPPMRVANRRKDWRLFMSARAADVHQESDGRVREDITEERGVREELAVMAKEVEALGASNFGEKERRKWEGKRFVELGAKAKKAPRTPPQIGKGMKRKADERAEKEREEAIASGMIRVKGSGIAKQRLRSQEMRQKRDDGINASEGKFRNGILHVKPMAETGKRGAKGGGAAKGTAHDSGFSGATWKGGRQKSKSKGKGKKPKSKKRR